jgi:hypothetical protein
MRNDVDLALVIDPKYINPCPLAIAEPLLEAVQHSEAIVGQPQPQFDAPAWVTLLSQWPSRDRRSSPCE